MTNKRRTAFVLFTAMAVFLLGCGNAKAGTVSDTAKTSEEVSSSAMTAEQQTDDENVKMTEEESASSAAADEGLRDLYAMETYDTVPEELLERHDDVDYGTIDENVEYYSETAGDNKYCNVLLPAGYDDNYCLENDGKLTDVARLVGDKTGITMTVFTDTPGMQIYTADEFDVPWGKGGVHYGAFAGIALETQYYPDAIHHKEFPQPVFTPMRPFVSKTIYSFSTPRVTNKG